MLPKDIRTCSGTTVEHQTRNGTCARTEIDDSEALKRETAQQTPYPPDLAVLRVKRALARSQTGLSNSLPLAPSLPKIMKRWNHQAHGRGLSCQVVSAWPLNRMVAKNVSNGFNYSITSLTLRSTRAAAHTILSQLPLISSQTMPNAPPLKSEEPTDILMDFQLVVCCHLAIHPLFHSFIGMAGE